MHHLSNKCLKLDISPSLCGYTVSLLLLWEGPSFSSGWKERNVWVVGGEYPSWWGCSSGGLCGDTPVLLASVTSCCSSSGGWSLSLSLLTGVRVKSCGNGWWIEPVSWSASTSPLLPILCPKQIPHLFVSCLSWAWGSVEDPPWFNHIHSTQCCSNQGSPTTAAC